MDCFFSADAKVACYRVLNTLSHALCTIHGLIGAKKSGARFLEGG